MTCGESGTLRIGDCRRTHPSGNHPEKSGRTKPLVAGPCQYIKRTIFHTKEGGKRHSQFLMQKQREIGLRGLKTNKRGAKKIQRAVQCTCGDLQFRRSGAASKTGKGFQTAKGVVFCRNFFLIPQVANRRYCRPLWSRGQGGRPNSVGRKFIRFVTKTLILS
jgi:hypothetical protein